jgi:hypothetical protein
MHKIFIPVFLVIVSIVHQSVAQTSTINIDSFWAVYHNKRWWAKIYYCEY